MPLLKLLIGNLREAHLLGMIDCNEAAISDHSELMNAGWNNAVDQDMEYGKWMSQTKDAFDRQFRPIQAFQGRMIPFCNVMRAGPFAKYWLDVLEPGLGDLDAGVAKTEITKLVKKSSEPAHVDDLPCLRGHFLHLNQWIKNAGPSHGSKGISISIGQLLDPATRPFWVGGRVHKPEISAQYWRDRLGLIHLSAGSRSCEDLLVRMRFVATMANEELPRTAHLEHRRRSHNSLWVFRPSVLHGGNRRFVQGIAADRAARPARRGCTRDISSAAYLEGERELLLLAGELANARLVGLDLLDGFPDMNAGRDDDDLGFVDAIAHQRNWV